MSRVAIIAVTALIGCSFEPSSAAIDAPATPPIDAPHVGDAPPADAADAGPDAPRTCAVACNAHATCDATQSPATCVCNTGLTGDGTTAGVCKGPASCEGKADGSGYTLYIGGDPDKPWTATCSGSAEYLAVSGANFGQYTRSIHTGGSDVRTTYSELRLNPATLMVDVDDQAFGSSSGQLQHGGTPGAANTVTSMPLGVAMDCSSSGSETGVARVDVTGTPFTIASTYSAQGNNSGSAATTPAADHRSIALTGGGNCGWTAVDNSPNNPFNTNGGGYILKLAYTPQ